MARKRVFQESVIFRSLPVTGAIRADRRQAVLATWAGTGGCGEPAEREQHHLFRTKHK